MFALHSAGFPSEAAMCEWALVMCFFALFGIFAAEFRHIDFHKLTVQKKGMKPPVMLMVCGHYRRFTEGELASCGGGSREQTRHIIWTQHWTITCTTLLNAQIHTQYKTLPFYTTFGVELFKSRFYRLNYFVEMIHE